MIQLAAEGVGTKIVLQGLMKALANALVWGDLTCKA